MLKEATGVGRRRPLPGFSRTTFVEWFESREAVPPADPYWKVVVYADLYTNYMYVERGKAAVRTLEALGAEVAVPQVPGSGRAPLPQGMIDTARSKATGVADEIGSYVDAGCDVVMFTGEYERLLPEAEFELLAENSYETLEYIYGLVSNGADISKLRHADGDTTVAYHSYCQQRTMGPEEYNRTILERYGCDVETNDVECGMARSFGYNSQFYEQSVDVGENLVGQIRDADPDVVVASGTSCLDQIEDLLEEQPQHVIELLAPA